ncbi:hypothetical protein O181_115487 [Austropuccinia psidii MF-1]|uniref:Uncharacterized protein n=1 Tax=Austropuccinia psidii MF-1 TaxID=1389203 RepID=A0A9Q3K7L8_9BASI|nr:hypothetical protein [Austropuccinia psidii MF-1]
MGPPTLVHLSTSLCIEPVTNSKYQYSIQLRNSLYSRSEYPEVPSGVGPSRSGNYFPKRPIFLTPQIPSDIGSHWSRTTTWLLVTEALLNEEGLALSEQTYLWRAQNKNSIDKSNEIRAINS